MINLLKLDEEAYAQICFIKKYRYKKNEENETKYNFFKIGIDKKISQEVKKWIENNFEKIKKEEIVEYNPSVELENLERIDLKSFDIWDNFEKKAFDGINLQRPELNKLKYNLTGVIIFVKEGKKYYGQITRIFPSNILNKKGIYNLYFNGEKFNDLVEEKGLRLYKRADFIFYSDNEKSEGIILDKNNFKAIFDLWEEYKKKSLENAKKVILFSKSKYFDSFSELICKDRQIQKMLMNPAFEKYLNEIDYNQLESLKKEFPEVAFELDSKSQDFILPAGREKEAIKDLIKAISGRYCRTLDNKHLLENSGVRRVLK